MRSSPGPRARRTATRRWRRSSWPPRPAALTAPESPAAGTAAAQVMRWPGTATRPTAPGNYGGGRECRHQAVIKPKPAHPAVPGGFTREDFTVDEQVGTVTCPAGVTRTIPGRWRPTAAVPLASDRQARWIRPPLAARPRAAASPMPSLAPVTRNVRPARSCVTPRPYEDQAGDSRDQGPVPAPGRGGRRRESRRSPASSADGNPEPWRFARACRWVPADGRPAAEGPSRTRAARRGSVGRCG